MKFQKISILKNYLEFLKIRLFGAVTTFLFFGVLVVGA